jgi:hypothetical protein
VSGLFLTPVTVQHCVFFANTKDFSWPASANSILISNPFRASAGIGAGETFHFLSHFVEGWNDKDLKRSIFLSHSAVVRFPPSLILKRSRRFTNSLACSLSHIHPSRCLRGSFPDSARSPSPSPSDSADGLITAATLAALTVAVGVRLPGYPRWLSVASAPVMAFYGVAVPACARLPGYPR